MGELASLQQHIRSKGLRIRVQGDRLLVKGSPCNLLVDTLEAIQKNKAELISILTQRSGTSDPNVAPLTFLQEWNWRIMIEENGILLERNAPAYFLLVDGNLKIDALSQSINQLVVTHESLRTRIIKIDSTPMQQIDGPGVEYLTVETVVVAYGMDPERAAVEALLRFLSEPLDLCKGPLFQAKLFQLDERKYILGIRISHMITDGESLTQLFTELWNSYRDLCDGKVPEQGRTRVQFADYAAWQRSELFDWHGNFWKVKLQGAQPVIWPTDREPGPEQSFIAQLVPIKFRQNFSRDLRLLAKNLGAIPGVVLFSAYSVFISHWCSQSDFVIPFVTNGRTAPEYAQVTGLFAYPVLVRLHVDQKMVFTDFVEYVVRELMLSLENADGGRLLLDNLPYRSQACYHWGTALELQTAATAFSFVGDHRFDIRVSQFAAPKGREVSLRDRCLLNFLPRMHQEGIGGGILYRVEWFSERKMQTLEQSMRATLERLVIEPNTRISEATGAVQCTR